MRIVKQRMERVLRLCVFNLRSRKVSVMGLQRHLQFQNIRQRKDQREKVQCKSGVDDGRIINAYPVDYCLTTT